MTPWFHARVTDPIDHLLWVTHRMPFNRDWVCEGAYRELDGSLQVHYRSYLHGRRRVRVVQYTEWASDYLARYLSSRSYTQRATRC